MGTEADHACRKNASVADSIPVLVNTWPVTYVYSKADLLLAYGTSIACAIVCCLVGLHAFAINNASYQNLFSTYLRATNDIDIRSHIRPQDVGADPLPKSLGKAVVTLSGRSEAMELVERS